MAPEPKHTSSTSKEFVAEAFGQALVELGAQRKDLAARRDRRQEQAGVARLDFVAQQGSLTIGNGGNMRG